MRQVYDPVRKIYVAATPEEIVRQSWIKKMIEELGYPNELLVVEKYLNELPHLLDKTPPHRRLDILCYGKNKDKLVPLLLLECKDEKLSVAAVKQVMGYNHFVQAVFVGAVNATQALIYGKSGEWSYVPSYQELCKIQM